MGDESTSSIKDDKHKLVRCIEWLQTQNNEDPEKLSLENKNDIQFIIQTHAARKNFLLAVAEDDATVPTGISEPTLEPQKVSRYRLRVANLQMECEWQSCRNIFNDYDKYQKHVFNHSSDVHVIENDIGVEYVCLWDVCGHKTSDFNEMVRHLNYHAYHGKLLAIGFNGRATLKLAPCKKDSSKRNQIPLQVNDYNCMWVGCEENIKYNSIQLFLDHVKVHTNYSDNILCSWAGCGAMFPRKEMLTVHVRSHTGERLIACYHCGQHFSNNRKLCDHLRRQNVYPNTPYVCELCGTRCATEYLLGEHTRQHISTYACTLCDMSATSPAALANHVRYRHLSRKDTRTHACPHCEYNMSGDRKSSKAWQFFTDLSNNKAKCNFCQKEFSYKGGGAYNLIRHTKSKHPHVFVAIRECPLLESIASSATEIQHPSTSTALIARNQDIPTASTSTASTSTASTSTASTSTAFVTEKPDSLPVTVANFKAPVTNTKLTQYFCKPLSAKKNDQLNKMLVKVFTKNYLAFHLVESPEFKEFIKELNPAYQLPSRKTLSNALMTNLYNLTRESVKSELNQAEYVCITTDGWTSSPNDSYVAVTVHFFNHQAELKTFLLECIQFSERHTAENLAQELKRITDLWLITEKIVAATSDNAFNIKAAIRLNNWKHVACFAHTLNLIVQTALKEMKTITIKIKHIVELFKRSPLASERLKNMQKKLDEPQLKLKQDVATRWNSTCEMFERVLTIKNSVMSTIAIDYPETENMTPEDIEVLDSAIQILGLFKDVTEEMSSEKNVTISESNSTEHASPHFKWDIVPAQYKKEATLTNSFSSHVLPNTMRYRHLSRKDTRTHACPHCEYKAITKSDLRQHILTHKKKKKTSKSIKKERFSDEDNSDSDCYEVQKEKKGSSARKYACHLCPEKSMMIFTRGNRLTTHLVKEHGAQWSFGHSRFRYQMSEDGMYRLTTTRYESLEVSEKIMDGYTSPKVPLRNLGLKLRQIAGPTANTPRCFEIKFMNEDIDIKDDNDEMEVDKKPDKENKVEIMMCDVDEEGNIISSEVIDKSDLIPKLERLL